MTVTVKGKRFFIWNCENVTADVGLPNTIVSDKLDCSLLSIPALEMEGIDVAVLQEKALIFDT